MSKPHFGGETMDSQAPPFFCGSSSESTCSSDLSDLTDPDRQMECSVERWPVKKSEGQRQDQGQGQGHGHKKNVPIRRDNKWELVDREKALPHELYLQQKMEAELEHRKQDWMQECQRIKTDFFNLSKTGGITEGEVHNRGFANESNEQGLDNREMHVRHSKQSSMNQSGMNKSGSYDPNIRTYVSDGPSQRKGGIRTSHVHHPDVKNNNSKVEIVSKEIKTYNMDGQNYDSGVTVNNQRFMPASQQQHSVSSYGNSEVNVPTTNQKTSSLQTDKKNDSSYFSMKFDLREFEPNEINVVAEGRQIHIRAFHEDNRGDGYMCAKQFKKAVDIPDNVDPEKVVSYLAKNGMLKIKAPFEYDRVRRKLTDEFSYSSSVDGNITPTRLNDSIDEDSTPTSHNISMDESMTAMSVSDNESVTPVSPAHSAKGTQSHHSQSHSVKISNNEDKSMLDSPGSSGGRKVVQTTKVTTSKQITLENGERPDFSGVTSSERKSGKFQEQTSHNTSKPFQETSVSHMLGKNDDSVSGDTVESTVVHRSHRSSSRRLRDRSGGKGESPTARGKRVIEITHSTSSRDGTDSEGNIEDLHEAPKGTAIPVMHGGSSEVTSRKGGAGRTSETVKISKNTSVARNKVDHTESEEDDPNNAQFDSNADKNIRKMQSSQKITTVNVKRRGDAPVEQNESIEHIHTHNALNDDADDDLVTKVNGRNTTSTSPKIISSSVKYEKTESVPIAPEVSSTANTTEKVIKISHKKSTTSGFSATDDTSTSNGVTSEDTEQTGQKSDERSHVELECDVDPSNEANYQGEKIIVPSKYKYQSQAFHCEPSYTTKSYKRTYEMPYYHRTHYEYNTEPSWGRAHYSTGRQEPLYGDNLYEHNLNRSFELQHSPPYQESSVGRSTFEYQQEPLFRRAYYEHRQDPAFISTNHEIEKGIYPRKSMSHHTSPAMQTKGATFVYRSGGLPMDQTRYGSPPHSPTRAGSPPRYNAVSRFRSKSTDIPVSKIKSENVNYEFSPMVISSGENAFADPLSQMLPMFHTPLIKETKLGKVLDLTVNLGGRYELEEVSVRVLGYKIYISAEHEDNTSEGRCYMREYNKDFMVPEELEGETIRAKLEPNGQLTIGSSVKSNDNHEAVLKLILDSMPVGGAFLEVERTEKA